MSIDVQNLKRVVAASAAVATAVQAGTAVLALKKGRRDYADAVWGPGLAAIAVTSAVVGNGNPYRRAALALATTGWAVRLEKQMLGRITKSDDEDSRYTEFLDGDGPATVVGKVFVTQGLSQLLVSAPVQLAAASTLPRSARRFLFPLGIGVMVAGAVMEATADRQKAQFQKRDEDDRPDVLDTGLWAISRHPNYLGDSIVWDGAWLASAASAAAVWTAPAPALMSYLLIFATGAKRTEKHMQERASYRDYQKRVPLFFPFPKRG